MSYSAYQPASHADPFRPTLEMCFRGHRQGVCSVTFQPTPSISPLIPKVVSGGADGAVMLWDAKSTTRTMRFMGHRGPVLAVSSSPRANLLVSGGHDGYIRLWIPNTRRTTVTFGIHAEAVDDSNSCGWRGHTGAARAIDFAQDGSDYLYTAGDDKTVKCWDLNYASSSQHIGVGPGNKFIGSFATTPSTGKRGTGHMNWVRALAVQSAYTSSSFFHYIASGGDDHAICVWDTRTRAPVHTLFDCNASVFSLSFHPGGYVLASGDGSGAVNLFDLRHTSSSSVSPTGRSGTAQRGYSSIFQRYAGAHKDGVQCVDFSPNGGWLLSAGNDSTAKLWDVKQACLYTTLQGHDGPVRSCCFSEDNAWLSTGGSHDKTILVWRSGLAATSFSSIGTKPLDRRESAAQLEVAPPPHVSSCIETPLLQPPTPMTRDPRDAPRRCKLGSALHSAGSGVASYQNMLATQHADTDGANGFKSLSSGPNVGNRTATSAAASLGRPPLPLSPTKIAPAGTPTEVLSREMAHHCNGEVSCLGRTEEQRSVTVHVRSFERSEDCYSPLAAAAPRTGGAVGSDYLPQKSIQNHHSAASTNALQKEEAESDSIDEHSGGALVAAEEREQQALVAQERAFQRLKEDRITQQRLAKLEEALASLAAHVQTQQQQYTREMQETRTSSKALADKYDANLADLKHLIAQLAGPVAQRTSASDMV